MTPSKELDEETRKRLYRRLVYIGENCDQYDPEDREMWVEYRRIRKRLGIPDYTRKGV